MEEEEIVEERVHDVKLKEELSKRYLSYAMSTIVARSLPDVRDGLKPVHRRLLYAMRQLKLDPKSGFKKCARVVGDVIGKYHPHGDSAVYGAMVRLAQDFSVRYPLVDGQGNFGNIDGDGAAAMRYTEARLTEFAIALMEGLNENAVDFILNALRARPHEITILAIGPFTNLAAAIKKDKNAFLLTKEVVIMGGDYTESEAEWNVLCDPEAAAALFSSGVKICAVGVDVTQRCRFSPETLAYLRALKNPKNRLLLRMTEIWIAHNAERGVPPTMHDPLTAETLFHKDLVQFETGRYEVCLTGEKRGFTQKSETGAQIEYAAAANVPKFMEIVKNNLSREDRRGGTNE